MSKKNKKLMCAVYLSVDAPDKEIQEKEEKQFRYIKDYCKGNGLKSSDHKDNSIDAKLQELPEPQRKYFTTMFLTMLANYPAAA